MTNPQEKTGKETMIVDAINVRQRRKERSRFEIIRFDRSHVRSVSLGHRSGEVLPELPMAAKEYLDSKSDASREKQFESLIRRQPGVYKNATASILSSTKDQVASNLDLPSRRRCPHRAAQEMNSQ